MKDLNDRYVDLAVKIVWLAAKDYRRALCKSLKNPFRVHSVAEEVIIECENFFCSEWGDFLTMGKGVDIMNRIYEEEIIRASQNISKK